MYLKMTNYNLSKYLIILIHIYLNQKNRGRAKCTQIGQSTFLSSVYSARPCLVYPNGSTLQTIIKVNLGTESTGGTLLV